MSTKRILAAAGLLCGLSFSVSAQEPLSAIDWLSDSVRNPNQILTAPSRNDISENALPERVTVSPLGRPSPDAVGLLPTSVTGLPRSLWGTSASLNLANRIKAKRINQSPAMQDLLYMLLLAELSPPADSNPESTLFLARIDTLLELGALDPAAALLERAGLENPAIFRRYFDVSLLMWSEDQACRTLRTTPQLSPTFPARIFCLARGGNWNAAALTLGTARALNVVSAEEDAVLARFLDPGLFEGEPPLPAPVRPTPLTFRMLDAIGEAIPTSALPLAFANSDLNAHSGWKSQLQAAERLARTGALDANILFRFYSERAPAASGGIWERVQLVQDLDNALSKGSVDDVARILPVVWQAFRDSELEMAFASMFASQLQTLDLPEPVSVIAFHTGLLSADYENVARARMDSANPGLLEQIATGTVSRDPAANRVEAAIRNGFTNSGIPVRLQSLTREGRLGEAILRAIELFSNGALGDLDELSDALTFFRAVGLEDTARQAALQLLLLDRRG